jgi:hypothetical protein
MLKEKIEIMRHERNTPLPLTYPYRRWTKKLSPSCHVMSIFTPVNKAPSGDWDRQVEGAQNSLHGLKGFSIRREVFLACTLSMSAKLSPDRIFHPTSRENDIFDSIPKIPVLWPARNLREIWHLMFYGVRAYVHCCGLPQCMLKAAVRIGSKISYIRENAGIRSKEGPFI